MKPTPVSAATLTAKKTQKPDNPADSVRNHVGTRTTVPRLIRIAELLRQGKCPPKERLAETFETSARTIERDFEFLRDQCRMEFAYDRTRKIHYCTSETVQLPGMQITVPEMMAMLVARRAAETHPGAGIPELVGTALEKITAFMTEDLVREMEHMDSLISYRTSTVQAESNPTIFPVLAQTLRHPEEVEIFYWSVKSSEHEWRRVRPLHLLFLNERWYLWCLDLKRNLEIRRFRLSRMQEIRATGRPFERPADFNPEKLLANGVGIYGGENPQRVRLRLWDVPIRILAERPLNANQTILPGPDNTAELTADVAITPEVEGIVLRWGSDIEVLEPISLRQTILEHARKIVARG